MIKIYNVFIIMFAFLITVNPFCYGEETTDGLEQEMNLVIKAAKDELSPAEKQEFLNQNHPLPRTTESPVYEYGDEWEGFSRRVLPQSHGCKAVVRGLLMQLGDPHTKKLLLLYANLPKNSHNELLEKGYLKWKYTKLDVLRQQVYKELVQLNIDMAKQQGLAANPNFSIEALENAEVGFAVVEIPETKQKVTSWMVLWSAGAPTWVTVVGAKSAGTQAYFAAHLNRLPLLKAMPESGLPE